MYESKRNIWEFEKKLSLKPRVWRDEAINLKYSAEVLISYDEEVMDCIFNKKIQPRFPPFFSARVARMLMGFALENMIKAILLQHNNNVAEVFSKEGSLKWGKYGHNLLELFKKANIDVSVTETKLLELWQICSLWAGRYPIPANENDMPKVRKGLPSREALLKRRQKIIEEAIKRGDPFIGSEINDLMHSGVGALEITIFREIFSKCDTKLKEI